MGPKLLFLIGILVAHGAFAAVLMQRDPPRAAATSTSCVKTPEPTPYFEQKREMLAMVVSTRAPGDALAP
jgi:hypothetical protein